jgi:autotransporter-associated beta strand protein
MMNCGPKSWNWRIPAGLLSARITPLLLAALLCAGGAFAQDGYWVNGNGGSWANGGNWDSANGIAGGADNTAYFGFGNEASISPNASFTLDGAQTIGNLCFTTEDGPANWSFSAGSGGSLTLDNTFEASQITVTCPSLQVTLNVNVAGAAGVEKDGPGTLILAAQNTYTGQTLVHGGGLNVTGLIGAGGVQVSGATLSGTGVIMGPVVMGSGSTLSLGNSSGPLTINNSLVLLSGSKTIVTVSSHPAVQGLSSVTYGGTLVVNNLSGGAALGQSFSIFGSAPASGNFSSIVPPPGPWLRWRFDPGTGQITVVSSASQPVFSKVNVAGTSLVCQVTAGPPGSPCYLTASPDLDKPQTAWTPLGTNVFDMSGGFTCTNDLSANGQMFLRAYVIPAP